MIQLTQPLREEHQELLPQIQRIQEIADEVGAVPITFLRQGLAEVSAFLTHHLLPHAQAEEHALYPVVGKLMGAPEATATMSRDHVEIKRLAERLGCMQAHLGNEPLHASQEQALRRVLYGLSELVTIHLAKEEEVYLPLLDARLTPQEAKRLFAAMEMAAQEAKGGLR